MKNILSKQLRFYFDLKLLLHDIAYCEVSPWQFCAFYIAQCCFFFFLDDCFLCASVI